MELGWRHRLGMSSETLIARDRCAKAPNDPKLSDCEAGQDACVAGLPGAGSMTSVAVLCSAWLGDVGSLTREQWNSVADLYPDAVPRCDTDAHWEIHERVRRESEQLWSAKAAFLAIREANRAAWLRDHPAETDGPLSHESCPRRIDQDEIDNSVLRLRTPQWLLRFWRRFRA